MLPQHYIWGLFFVYTYMLWKKYKLSREQIRFLLSNHKNLPPWKTHLSRKAGLSGSGTGAELCELSISEERPRPSRKASGSSKDVEEYDEPGSPKREEWDEAWGKEEDDDGELEDRSGPSSPDARRGETARGGGGNATGDEEREPGWEKAWSLGGIWGGVSSSLPSEIELVRASAFMARAERLCLEGRRGGTGLRGGSTGLSSKQEAKEEADEGDGGGRWICRCGPKGARGMGSGEEGRERPVAIGTCSFTITYINRETAALC